MSLTLRNTNKIGHGNVYAAPILEDKPKQKLKVKSVSKKKKVVRKSNDR